MSHSKDIYPSDDPQNTTATICADHMTFHPAHLLLRVSLMDAVLNTLVSYSQEVYRI